MFWGLKEDLGKDKESYIAHLFVKNGSEILDSRNLSFSYQSPVHSKFKLVDFSADSKKAFAMITLKSSTDLSTGLRSVQIPEPIVINLNLKLLSGNEVVYSESQENIFNCRLLQTDLLALPPGKRQELHGSPELTFLISLQSTDRISKQKKK